MLRLFVAIFALCLIKEAFPAPVKKDRCSHGMDIAVLIDATTKYNETEWKDVLNIPKLMVDTFGASEQGNHYAVMTFNSTPSIEMKFNQFNGTNINSEKIKNVIDGLKIRGGQYTFIDRALTEAQQNLFTLEAGMRQNRTKVAVVISDSVQGAQWYPLNPIQDASNNLQAKGVEVYAIGLGSDIDVLDLIETASSAENVFSFIRARDFVSGSSDFIADFCKST